MLSIKLIKKKTIIILICALITVIGLIPLLIVNNAYMKYKDHEAEIEKKITALQARLQGKRILDTDLYAADDVFKKPYFEKIRFSSPTRIYDRIGRLIGEFMVPQNSWINSTTQLPSFLIKALLATEDRLFYTHKGYNIRTIIRALIYNLFTVGRKQGGSTITQQLAKLLFTRSERTYFRKVFELFCSFQLEKMLTKDEILLLYFNTVNFGNGAYGIREASLKYFDKEAKFMNILESSLIIAMLANPTYFSPFYNPDPTKIRHYAILRKMVDMGYVSESYVKRNKDLPWERLGKKNYLKNISFWGMTVDKAPHFNQYIVQKLRDRFTVEDIMNGGFSIHTSFDITFNTTAVKLFAQQIAVYKKENEQIEGALLAIDNASGEILAMIGGSVFNIKNQLNRSMQIQRQIGSTVKPFIYSSAFEQESYTADSVIEDSKVTYSIPGKRRWTPKNYSKTYHGEVTVAEALYNSYNVSTIKILDSISIGQTIQIIKNCFYNRNIVIPRNLSIALGSFNASLLDVSCGYTVFMRNGNKVVPLSINYIKDSKGDIILSHDDIITRNKDRLNTQALTEETCSSVRDILKKVVTGGTASSAAKRVDFSLPAAGKTGTTEDFKDAWFCGFTYDFTMVIWFGCDDFSIPIAPRASGGRIAAPLWFRIVKELYKYKRIKNI
ncbi:transglycosylase domain-containing protein [Spirochaetota bacterium]